MTLSEQKRAFVEAWLRQPNDPFKAACSVLSGNVVLSLEAAMNWVKDPETLAIKAELEASFAPESFLPTKEDHIRDLQEKAEIAFLRGAFPTYEKLMRQVAEIRGFIAKQAAVAVTTNVTTQRVMVIKESENDDDWERDLAENQSALVNRDVSIN